MYAIYILVEIPVLMHMSLHSVIGFYSFVFDCAQRTVSKGLWL